MPLLLVIREAQPARVMLCFYFHVHARFCSTMLMHPLSCHLHLLPFVNLGLHAFVQIESIREEDVDVKAGGGPATQTPAPPPPPKK